ncbi:hypothetical protein BPTFM16_02106 [Altererythrobacter insulae]|nr:hypothetical protein BPTFM16_02106 [Altererythrobacter insulae]
MTTEPRTIFSLLLAASPIAVLANVNDGAIDDDTVVLSPSSEWRLREMDDRCRLSRRFGEGENRTTLWLDQGGAEPFYNVTLIGRPFRHLYGQFTRVRFGPDEARSTRGYISAKSSTGRPVMVMYGIQVAPQERNPEDAMQPIAEIGREREEAITQLHIANAVVDPVLLEIGAMAEPLERLRTCAKLLGARLTIASMATNDKARGAVPVDQDTWSKYIKYPDYLLRSRVVGEVRIRLTVAPSGKAVNCQVTGSSSPQVFDDEVCFALIKHARFEPALDLEGQPTTSYYTQEVIFSIK